MSHVITYTTSTGRVFDLQGVSFVDSADLRGWEWGVGSDTHTISRKTRTYKANVTFFDADVANAFLMATASDAESNLYGTLDIDGWQLSCTVTAGTASAYMPRHHIYQVTFYAPEPVWRKYTEHVFMPDSGAPKGEELDYPIDFEFDFDSPNTASGERTFTSPGGCSVRVTFFGPCISPYCRIIAQDGTTNIYGVDYTAAGGERIVIDPTGRRTVGGSVYLVGNMGEKTNLYDVRRRGASGSGSYVFERMPAGELKVSWPQSYGINVEAIEERAVLPWT